MKILIIGSKGFIGSHCVKYFSTRHEVYECDVVVDYTSQNYTQIDATNADYHAVFEQIQYDACINCSGAASVPDSIKHPQRDFLLNTANVFKQLDAIRLYNHTCKYINLSSAAVYGNPEYLPIDENHPLNPISPYGFHKKMAEDICESFYKNFNLKVCSLRIFSAYGAGLKKQLFWDLYRKSQKSSKEIILFGTGEETRDFIHILDVVNAIDLVIEDADFLNNRINVAMGQELSIKYVAETFFSGEQSSKLIRFQGENRQGDPNNWVADISILKKFGFIGQVNLKEGLSNYLTWAKELK